MGGLMQNLLGADWERLPPSLKAHYRGGLVQEHGAMDIEFPWWMTPVLVGLRCVGALVSRGGQQIATAVEKTTVGTRQHWKRTLTYADGQSLHFNSVWEITPQGELVEYVTSWLGLQMAPEVRGNRLHYSGVCFVVRLGRLRWRIPENWALGHTTIEETAIDEARFAMDFRLTHPWFGQVFRYAGTFATTCEPGDVAPARPYPKVLP